MARKILNRKELREENDAAEKAEAVPKAAVKKAPAKCKSRAKVAKEVRLKAFWGVFNQSLRRISLLSTASVRRPTKSLGTYRIAENPAFCPTCEGSHRRIVSDEREC